MITDSGAFAVTGTTTLTAGAANNITLDNANNFAAVSVVSGNNVRSTTPTRSILEPRP